MSSLLYYDMSSNLMTLLVSPVFTYLLYWECDCFCPFWVPPKLSYSLILFQYAIKDWIVICCSVSIIVKLTIHCTSVPFPRWSVFKEVLFLDFVETQFQNWWFYRFLCVCVRVLPVISVLILQDFMLFLSLLQKACSYTNLLLKHIATILWLQLLQTGSLPIIWNIPKMGAAPKLTCGCSVSLYMIVFCDWVFSFVHQHPQNSW